MSTPERAPHHDGSERWVHRSSEDGAAELIVDAPGATSVWLRAVVDGEPRWREAKQAGVDEWRVQLDLTQDRTHYRFLVDGRAWITAAGVVDHDPTDRTDHRLDASTTAPGWARDQVWYQVFPDRFATTGRHRIDAPWIRWRDWDHPVAGGEHGQTDLYGGDLDGITERLDHLVDLGVTGVYVTPVFPARSAHRYDATSFDHVDPVLGGDEAMARLSTEAHRRGLRILGDLTLNHTGAGHHWFEAAQADPEAAEAAYYIFENHPDDYLSWLGVPSLPKLDHRSPELRRVLYDGPDSIAVALARRFDLDGWRIDAANMIGRHDGVDLGRQTAATFRASMDRYAPGRWLIAEHAHDFTEDLDGLGWHGAMNYAGVGRPVAAWLGRGNELAGIGETPPRIAHRNGLAMAKTMDAVRSGTSWSAYEGSLTLLGSHDTARWRSVADTDEHARVGIGLLMTLPGVPSVFYGDEVGLVGDNGDEARTPMPWQRERWDHDLLSWYRRLIGVRRRHASLRRGGFRWLHVGADAVVFLRELDDERVLVRAARAPHGPLGLPELQPAVAGASHLLGGDDLERTPTGLALPAADVGLDAWLLG